MPRLPMPRRTLRPVLAATALALVLVLVLVAFSGPMAKTPDTRDRDLADLAKIAAVLRLVRNYGYHELPLPADLARGAARGLGYLAGEDRLTTKGEGTNLILGSAGHQTALTFPPKAEPREQAEAVRSVLNFGYGAFPELEAGDMLTATLNGALEAMDPYTLYMPPDSFREMQIDTSGEYFGVGMEISMKDGLPTVVSPFEDGPAHKAGLVPGDAITAVDGDSTKDLTLFDTVMKIRGPKGETVVLTVRSPGEDRERDVPIVRDEITVRAVKVDEPSPGYLHLRLTRFNEHTHEQLRQALDAAKGLKGVILDLRNNPGGLLGQSVQVSDAFLGKGEVVSIKGRDGRDASRFESHNDRDDCRVPVVVLINKGSASASEIVTGAFQDRSRALILGRTSYGKGSVQTIIPLRDDSGLKVTTAMYFTPAGRQIHDKGIVPDYTVSLLLPERQDPDADQPNADQPTARPGKAAPPDAKHPQARDDEATKGPRYADGLLPEDADFSLKWDERGREAVDLALDILKRAASARVEDLRDAARTVSVARRQAVAQ